MQKIYEKISVKIGLISTILIQLFKVIIIIVEFQKFSTFQSFEYLILIRKIKDIDFDEILRSPIKNKFCKKKYPNIYIYCFFNCKNSSIKFNLKMIFYNLEKINKFFLIKIRCFLIYWKKMLWW